MMICARVECNCIHEDSPSGGLHFLLPTIPDASTNSGPYSPLFCCLALASQSLPVLFIIVGGAHLLRLLTHLAVLNALDTLLKALHLDALVIKSDALLAVLGA